MIDRMPQTDMTLRNIATCMAEHFTEEDNEYPRGHDGLDTKTHFNAIVTVGDNANDLGDPLVEELRRGFGIVGISHIPARKDPETDDIHIVDRITEGMAAIVLDDTCTDSADIEAAMVAFRARAIQETGFKHDESHRARVVGAVALFHPSDNDERQLSDGITIHRVGA